MAKTNFLGSIVAHSLIIAVIFLNFSPLKSNSSSEEISVNLITPNEINNPIKSTTKEEKLFKIPKLNSEINVTQKKFIASQVVAKVSKKIITIASKIIKAPVIKKINVKQEMNQLLNELNVNDDSKKTIKTNNKNLNSQVGNNNGMTNAYADAVINLIRPYVLIPQNIDNHAVAVMEVKLFAPNQQSNCENGKMQVAEIKLISSSGNVVYDQNVKNAIFNAHCLPELPNGANYAAYRVLYLHFKPE